VLTVINLKIINIYFRPTCFEK